MGKGPTDGEIAVLSLREDDVRELEITGTSRWTALSRAVSISEWVKTLRSDTGVILAVVGLTKVSETIGSPWAVGTDRMMNSIYLWKCLEKSKEIINLMHMKYPTLSGGVDVRNETHVRWLMAVGFTVYTDRPIPVGSGMLYPFVKESRYV
jgi:hypothetical protein